MLHTFAFRCLLAVAAVLSAGEAALAQSAACQRYQAELASLPRGGRQAAASAERQRVEIGRMAQYYRSIGCERGNPFGFFGSQVPAECGAIAQRIRQMEASYGQFAAQANSGEIEQRRRQLQAAIDQTCGVPQEAARPRSPFDQTYGGPQRTERAQPRFEVEEDEERGSGGRRLVCVRSCDGFFFPLSTSPSGRESADSMCQALCPGAETAAFTMPNSDDGLDQAVSLKGRPYPQSPNAFKYQKSFDPSCSCKKNGQSWAQLLSQAEKMLDQRRGDIIVTAQKAEELSRPKITQVQLSTREKKAAERKAEEAAEAQAAAETGATAPTAGGESAGIGPKAIETNRTIPKNEGERREVASADGLKRVVRVIAPNVIPVPETRTP